MSCMMLFKRWKGFIVVYFSDKNVLSWFSVHFNSG